jgi:hypothetical protein
MSTISFDAEYIQEHEPAKRETIKKIIATATKLFFAGLRMAFPPDFIQYR